MLKPISSVSGTCAHHPDQTRWGERKAIRIETGTNKSGPARVIVVRKFLNDKISEGAWIDEKR